eukprot:CAMPEP_0185728022 /NCGR_PEP_ID=MMETSP1171-20130828/3521_1 /TAXON_ID=374046 /ORGANISM="Helicotheca tamensis, Strain CCMP826" /LENGTH=77 /DNA_ID=CAMNT_0028396683 /DNA_START=187 /DNA_END=420 /DNA_ORIENTATION=-
MSFRSTMVGMIEDVDDDNRPKENDSTFVNAEKRKSRMEEEAEGALGPEAIVTGGMLVAVSTLAILLYLYYAESLFEL